MTQSKSRKNAKNKPHHARTPTSAPKKSASTLQIFLMYFVIFGAILAFIGLMGNDSLPGSGPFLWVLVALNFIITIIATISHTKSGKKSKIDEIASKW
ncbi:MAG: hypothetical protein HOK75_05165 [Phycisphaerae bacterium]|nr:hypothetical protein [Phycisphaerae bacterium]MBT7657191.1 hypothetical protein [Phycisphaerae bacterium]